MNKFNLEAATAGREFARAHPNATGVDIDNASPVFNPARRFFQEAAYDLLNRQNTKIFYRWNVGCRCGRASGGMASTVKEAQEFIKDTIELYRDQNREPISYAIYDQEEVCIVAMDKF